MAERWRIQMFGGLRANCGERVIAHFRTQKTGSLLAYLARHCERSHSREFLAELLWPESEPESSRMRLRTALSSLRQELEPEDAAAGSVIQADRQSVQLNPEALTTDVAQFEAALEAAKKATSDEEQIRHLEQAVALYAGEFLSGYYDEWTLPEQRHFAEQYFQAVRRVTAHFEKTEQCEQALGCARRAVAVDPLREEAHQDLMRLLLATGQPFAALRRFRELERILREDLEVEPSPITLKVLREIEAQAKKGLAMLCEAGLTQDQRRSVDEFAKHHRRAVLALLISDIEQSTRVMAEMGEKDALALFRRHEAILRDVLGKFSEAHEVSTAGDSFFLVFANPSNSVRFALQAQRRLRELAASERPDFRVHMGIHLGEVVVADKGEGGPVEDIVAHYDVVSLERMRLEVVVAIEAAMSLPSAEHPTKLAKNRA
jgi:DNA-binding SARP family transcriptional activator